MRESAESRSAAVRAVLLRFYPHQYAWGKSCALTVSLLLRFTEAAHDSVHPRRIRPIGFIKGFVEFSHTNDWESHTNDWESIKSHRRALWLLSILKKLRCVDTR